MKSAARSSSRRAQARAQRQRKQRLSSGLVGLGILLLAGAFVFFFNGSKASGNQVQPPQVGIRLSNFALADISGQEVRLSDYHGQVVLVNAWATWCPPCRAEMPALNDFYQRHSADGFVVLAVNAGDPPGEAAAFAQGYQLAFPVLLDPQTRLLNDLRIRSFPTSILVDRDGVVKEIHVGMLTAEQVETKVKPLLGM